MTHHTKFNLEYIHLPLKATYRLRMHKFTFTASGERSKIIIVINQVITHHKKYNPEYAQTCSFKGNLQSETAPVHSMASGKRKKNVIITDQVTTHYTKFNPKYKNVYSKATYWLRMHQFKVYTASWERK